MVYKDYDYAAKEMINLARAMCPKDTYVLVEWRGKIYFGGMRQVAPDYSEEIVFLNKPRKNMDKSLAEALRKTGCVLELKADDKIHLDKGIAHLLRRVGYRLTTLTKEQAAYMIQNPLHLRERKLKDFLRDN